jgi:beta-mannosidase
VPADAQYGSVAPDRVTHLVELAARSGARLLRVWGGGLIETEEFYDACDRAGLLVWQEFSQSSSGQQSAPATDDAFVALMRSEAEALVPSRTHHPSLFIWGGGNELDLDGTPLDEARSPVLAALRDAVQRLDPGRPWLPTSPSGPRFHFRDGGHDVHGPWEHQGLRAQHELYDAGSCLAHTEFGVEGMTNRRALLDLVPGAHRWPAGRGNPVYRHLGDWWNNEPLVQAAFGNRLTDLESLRRASQLLQATGLQYAVEADRRRFPACSMVLPWQLNESYPNAWCTSCVDHAGNPKPAYHAVARAFAPQRVTVRVPTSVWAGEPRSSAQAWVWSHRPVPAGSCVQARLRDAAGTVLAERSLQLDDAVADPRPAGTLEVATGVLPADAAFAWDVAWLAPDGAELDRDVMIASSGSDFTALLDLAAATVSVTTSPGQVHVAHTAGPMIVGLELLDDRPAGSPGWVLPSGDPRPLLPGQSRTFTVVATGAATAAPAALSLEAWNLPAVPVTLKEPAR